MYGKMADSQESALENDQSDKTLFNEKFSYDG